MRTRKTRTYALPLVKAPLQIFLYYMLNSNMTQSILSHSTLLFFITLALGALCARVLPTRRVWDRTIVCENVAYII